MLRIPDFRAKVAPLSVTSTERLAAALDAPGPVDEARALGLMRRIARGGLGGAFWLPAPISPGDGASVVGEDPGDLGLLALFAGWPVRCLSPVWFAGRGLTLDEGVTASAPRTLGRLAHAALIGGVTYTDPFTGTLCEAERAVELVEGWMRVCAANRGIASCVGMQVWKRRRVARFLHDGTRPPVFRGSAAAAVAHARATGGAVAVWASRVPAGLKARAQTAGVPVLLVEDGFLRSVGLGSDFTQPCSIVVDGRGLYYDAARPSDLEVLLQEAELSPEILARAEALVARVVRSGVTKYGAGGPAAAAHGPGRTVLVVGQVADDLSVTLGGGVARGNADLLARVRAEEPDARILYRPHPDVEAGHRPGALPDGQVRRYADGIARGNMSALLDAADAVHTMTSLAGFEALVRGRRVVTWGRPFYAGWGLTQDRAAMPRRTRTRTVAELAACALLLYPRYLDPVTGLPCPAEVLLDRMAEPALWRPGLLVRARKLHGRAMRGFRAPAVTPA